MQKQVNKHGICESHKGFHPRFDFYRSAAKIRTKASAYLSAKSGMIWIKWQWNFACNEKDEEKTTAQKDSNADGTMNTEHPKIHTSNIFHISRWRRTILLFLFPYTAALMHLLSLLSLWFASFFLPRYLLKKKNCVGVFFFLSCPQVLLLCLQQTNGRRMFGVPCFVRFLTLCSLFTTKIFAT